MGPARSSLWTALLCALLAFSAAATISSTTAAPATDVTECPRGCRCFAAEGEAAANCSSPAAALALGSRLRVLRLSRYDDHFSVKEGAFRSLNGLRELHLDHLGLVKVYPGAFRGLTDLETLDLSHNALSAGDELSRALRDLPSLKRLSLRGNNFGASHGVPPALVSRTVKFVDLGRCKIRDLPVTVLAGLTHVRHVVLDGNFIRDFSAAAFPRSVVSIDLSHNDIDRMSRAELNKLENVDSIELAENPLHCTCELLKISFEYNMNKAVICAYPKQLMGKDLLKIKKHQVCGGHKKVKREAGNELDDEELSAEELDNEEDLVGQNPEDAETEDAAPAGNSASKEHGIEKTPDEASETAADGEETKSSGGNVGEQARSESPINEEKSEVIEDDAGPEDIDGVNGEKHDGKDSKDPTAEDAPDETEGNEDHVSPNLKSELPPDEELDESEQDTPVAAPERSNDQKEEAPVDDIGDENEDEPEEAGGAIREDTEAHNAAETSNDDENTGDYFPMGTGSVSVEEPVDEEPPDSLPASAYNHVQAVAENASPEAQDEDDTDGENNEEKTVEGEIPKATDSVPKHGGASEKNVGDTDNTDTSLEEGDVFEEPKDETNEDGEGEAPENTGDGENNLSEERNESPQHAEVPDSITDVDVAESDSQKETNGSVPEHGDGASGATEDDVEETDPIGGSHGGTHVDGEGARMEAAPDDGDDDDVDQDALNAVNNEDDILSPAVYSRPNEDASSPDEGGDSAQDSQNAEEGEAVGGAGVLETDEDVENVRDNSNVVHTSGIGARAEEDADPDDTDADDETDGDTGNTDVLGEADVVDDNAEGNAETEVEADTADENTKDETDEVSDRENVDNAEDPLDGVDEPDAGDDIVAAVPGNEADEKEEGGDEESLGAAVLDADQSEEAEEERLEEELKEDRSHATLGHEDIDAETTGNDADNDGKDGKELEERTEEADDDDDDDQDERPIVIPPLSGDTRHDEDDEQGTEDDDFGSDADVIISDPNVRTGHSVDKSDKEDELTPKEYEEVAERGEDKSPGGSLSLAPVATDTEDSDEEEGSGNAMDGMVDTLPGARNKDDEFAEDTEAESGRNNEAVPPLGNADSKEFTDLTEERPLVEMDTEDTVPSEEPPVDVFGVGDNDTEETGSGAGSVIGAGIQIDDGDQEPASNEDEEGSGHSIVSGPVPTIKEDDPDDKEEGSGKGIFLPFVPVPDRTSDGDEPDTDNADGDDVDDVKATTQPPVVAPEDEIIPRHHVPAVFAAPPQSAPPRHHEEEEEEPVPAPEDEDTNDPEGEDGRDRSEGGRALGVPMQPEGDDDQTKDEEAESDAGGPVVVPAGDPNVEVDPNVADGDDAQKGNIAEADGDRADGSALNNDGAYSMNTIASYVVLGAIMLIVVILLGYAVCRSRRQKSANAREKDVENARELQDVNKPLINNHHPSAPEKQPLDETRPLMTKEQEASLTIDPEKKPLPDDKTDAANHKPKQNGSVPEVVVERQTAPPVVNGKASSPAAERAPSPAVPLPVPSPTHSPAAPPAASPVPSPTADGHANGTAVPLANGGSISPSGANPATNATAPAASPANGSAPPVSPGAVRVVAKELPDSVAKRPVIIMNRGADPPQQV